MKYLPPASNRVQGTEETFRKSLRDDRGGWREAGKETRRKGAACWRRVRTSMWQEVMKRDEARTETTRAWSKG